MPLSFVVVCEAPADQRTGCDLADRVLYGEIPWLKEETLPYQRVWRGFRAGDPCLLWRDVSDLTEQRGIRAHGGWGERGKLEAAHARKALLLVHDAEDRADAAVLLRDDDRRPEVRVGFDQARDNVNIGIPVVIGVATTKRECWVLAGFEPQDNEEGKRLADVRKDLGFDPREKAQQLTARHDSDKRSAKRVLNLLTGRQPDREADCWRKTDLALLASRGDRTGLAAYLGEVRDRLVPLLRRSASR